MILAFKVSKCVELVNEALKNNQAVVIGLFSTGEAKLQQLLKETNQIEFDSIHSTTYEILISLIQMFPFDQPKDILEKINNLQFILPLSPLDNLIDKLGGIDKVAEMSGRTTRIIKNPYFRENDQDFDDEKHEFYDSDDSDDEFNCYGKQKAYIVQSRQSKSDNLSERDDFMSGKKQIAIITGAASVGISLQASKNCLNQKQRVHIILELPWSADKAVQQLGRTHRSHQKSCPHYKMLITNIGGEWRLASMVASRISSLGALTSGERKSGVASGSLSSFELHDESVLMACTNTATILSKNHQKVFTKTCFLGLFDDLNSNSKNLTSKSPTKRFLNRLLGLQIDEQEIVFSQFVLCYQNALENAEKEVFDVRGKLLSIKNLIKPAATPSSSLSLSNHLHRFDEDYSVLSLIVEIDRGFSWEKISTIYNENFNNIINLEDSYEDLSEKSGFYVEIFTTSTPKIFLASVANKKSYTIILPHLGKQRVRISENELVSNYKKVSNYEAKRLWEKWYHENDSVGKGKRKTHKELLIGPLFLLFQKFPNLTKKGNLQCVRAEVTFDEDKPVITDFPSLSRFQHSDYVLKFVAVLNVLNKALK